MFRTRTRKETTSGPTAMRGSVGSARVWDEARRGRGTAPSEPATLAAAAEPCALAPGELRALVYGIVQVTLDTRLADCAPARRVQLARELEQRLLGLFDTSAAFPANASATDAPAALVAPSPSEGELELTPVAPPESEAEDEPVPLFQPSDPAERVLALELEDRLARLGGPLAARTDLRQRLIELALGCPLPADLEGPSEATGDELLTLDMLQRRARKLELSLQEARAALAYVSGLEHVDVGIASIYRSVQGLTSSDPRREMKQGVLESIFRANLSLQKSDG